MNIKEISFVPHSDVGASEMNVVKQHKNLINDEQYSDATDFLNNEVLNKGVRASLLNSLQEKIQAVQSGASDYVLEKDENWSIQEPDISNMNEQGFKFWIKLYGRGGTE